MLPCFALFLSLAFSWCCFVFRQDVPNTGLGEGGSGLRLQNEELGSVYFAS